MLQSLIVQNYSLIEELHIDFKKGFSVITGETGAGKSILLGALGLLLGQRADSKYVRVNATKCLVEGRFSLDSDRLRTFFLENDFDYEPTDCIIRREVYASGKSRAFINDTPAQLSQLKELGEKLIDIHSQHKNLLLNNESFQLEVLDIMAKNELNLRDYQKNYRHLQALEKELNQAREETLKSKEEEDFLQFQYNQLEEANLIAGEQEQLEEELEILSHAEDIKESLYSSANLLEESEGNILSQIRSTQGILKNIQDVYTPAQEWNERLDNAYIELKDIVQEISGNAEDIEFNPTRLDYVNDRLNTLYSLEKKFKKETVEELIEFKESLDEKLNLISHSDEKILELEEAVKKQKKELTTLAEKLSRSRKKSAETVIEKMKSTLSSLGMPNVQFQIELISLKEFKLKGKDEVCFLFNANKGGTLQELSQVASGGEIARVMLSLKSLMAGVTDLPTLIFDEIDTGVSGSIAEKMALIMKQMCEAEGRQVLSITHLPQIAAKGSTHYKVYKEDKNDQTVSSITELTAEERVQELAHMLSGENMTEAALNNARELLKSVLI